MTQIGQRFGLPSYRQRYLVVEVGAATLRCRVLGIGQNTKWVEVITRRSRNGLYTTPTMGTPWTASPIDVATCG